MSGECAGKVTLNIGYKLEQVCHISSCSLYTEHMSLEPFVEALNDSEDEALWCGLLGWQHKGVELSPMQPILAITDDALVHFGFI